MSQPQKVTNFLRQGVLAPLRIRDFRVLLASNFFWWQARWMESIITGWLVLELTDSAWQVALMAFYRSIPFLLTGIWSGSVIDRFGRRNCILFAQTANTLIHVSVAALLWLDRLEMWHLVAAALIMGTVWSVDWPARRSLIPDLVGKEGTVDAMILENIAQNVSSVVGPLMSGVFISLLGAAGGYSVLAATAVIAWLALLTLSQQPLPRTAMPSSMSPWSRLREGLAYARENQSILGVMLVTLVMNVLAFPYMDLLPVFARDVLGQGPLGLGVLGAANGIGAFVGLALIAVLRRHISNGWIFVAGSFFQCIVLIAFASSTDFALSAWLLVLGGIGRACFGVMQSSIMLLVASDVMRSRAMGSLTLFIGLGPFGRLQIGGMAEGFGAPLALGIQAGIGALCLAAIAFWLPDFRRQGRAVVQS